MRRILSALARVVKLFVDDRGFATAIILWLGLAVLVLPGMPEGYPVEWSPALLRPCSDPCHQRPS